MSPAGIHYIELHLFAYFARFDGFKSGGAPSWMVVDGGSGSDEDGNGQRNGNTVFFFVNFSPFFKFFNSFFYCLLMLSFYFSIHFNIQNI